MLSLLRRLANAVLRFARWLFADGGTQSPSERATERTALPEHGDSPITVIFREPDIRTLLKQLKLEELGRERGRQELPPSHSTEPDPVERDVISTIEEQMRQACSDYERAAESFQVRKHSDLILGDAARISAEKKGAIADLELLSKRNSGARVMDSFAKAKEHTKAFKDFRCKNDLHEPAMRLDRRRQMAVLLVLVLLESLANGLFFATGNEQGFFGGAMLALIYAALNTVVSFILGWMSRYLHDRRPTLKITGIAIVLFWLLWMTVANFSIAHYRDALNGPNPDEAGAMVLPTMLDHPFLISSFSSITLLILGGIFACVAFYEGMKMDDPYPGYGRRSRDYESARTDFQRKKQHQIELLRERRNEFLANIRREIAGTHALIRAHHEAVEKELALRDRLKRVLGSLESGAATLLSVYRNANRISRSSEPPSYFSAAPALVRPQLKEAPPLAPIDEKKLTEMNDVPSEITGAFEKLVSEFPSLEDHD